MEVKEFAKELDRMCKKSYNVEFGCTKCPAYKEDDCCILEIATGINVLDLIRAIQYNDYKITEIVEQWSKEHPRKTRAIDFFGKFPNAPKQENGMPRVCAAECGYTECTAVFNEDAEHNIENCRKCWNEPVE